MVSKEGKANNCLGERVQRRGALAMGSLQDIRGLRWSSRLKEVSVLHSDYKDPGFHVGEKGSFGFLIIDLVAYL